MKMGPLTFVGTIRCITELIVSKLFCNSHFEEKCLRLFVPPSSYIANEALLRGFFFESSEHASHDDSLEDWPSVETINLHCSTDARKCNLAIVKCFEFFPFRGMMTTSMFWRHLKPYVQHSVTNAHSNPNCGVTQRSRQTLGLCSRNAIH
jgi:hypothetical protein